MGIDTWWNKIVMRAYDHQTSEAYEAYHELSLVSVALRKMIIWRGQIPYYRTANGVPMEIPKEIKRAILEAKAILDEETP